jgi:hypothetical protein
VIDTVRERNAMVAAFLSGSRPLALEGTRLRVGFPASGDFARKKVESNCALVQEVLRGLTGQPLEVRCVLHDGLETEEAAPALSEEELLRRLKDEFGATEVFDSEEP